MSSPGGQGRRGSFLSTDIWLALALVCFLAGTVLLITTWYEVAGLALIAEQLPYLVSGGLGGLALMIAGAGALVASRTSRLEARIVELLVLAREPAPGEAATTAGTSPQAVFTVPGGQTYHLAGCPLLTGKDATPVTPEQAADRGLAPCPVCH